MFTLKPVHTTRRVTCTAAVAALVLAVLAMPELDAAGAGGVGPGELAGAPGGGLDEASCNTM
jgi:hypothetical protein